MPTPKKGARLGGSPAHQKLILANLATSLFEHGRITTTEAKARMLRPYAERLITKAKKGDLHNRRQVLRVVRDKGVVHSLFEEIGPRFAERPGGYTRITKIGPRHGDNAPMAVIELVEALTAKVETVREAEAATKRTAKKAPAKKAAAAPSAEEAAEAATAAAEEAVDNAAEGDVEGAEEAAVEAREAADEAAAAAEASEEESAEEAAGDAEAVADIAEEAADEAKKDQS